MFMNRITKFSSNERREKFMHRAESNIDTFPKGKLQKKCLQHKFPSNYFHKNLQHQISRKSFQWVSELLHAKRQTDGRTNKHDKAYSRFFRLYERLQCCLRELLIAFILDLKNNSGTIEMSYTPAISYLNVIF